jgi:hypothetical protein
VWRRATDSLWSVTLFRDIQTAALDAGNVLARENFMVGNKKIFDGQRFYSMMRVSGGAFVGNLRAKIIIF